MKDQILLRGMVKEFFESFDIKKHPQTRKGFIKYFSENKRGCLYCSDTLDEYRERIDKIFGTQIPPKWLEDRQERKKYFMGYQDDGSENLVVATKGIKFIDPWWFGFFDIVIREHPGITKYLVGGGIIAGMIELIKYIL